MVTIGINECLASAVIQRQSSDFIRVPLLLKYIGKSEKDVQFWNKNQGFCHFILKV